MLHYVRSTRALPAKPLLVYHLPAPSSTRAQCDGVFAGILDRWRAAYWPACLDVLCCIDYLASRPDVDPSRIGIFGSGPKGLEALFSTALSDRVRTLMLERTLTDFGSLVESEDYNLAVDSFAFGLLKHFDLPEICSAIAPRPLWLVKPASPTGTDMPLNVVNERYSDTKKAYADAQQAGRFLVEAGETDRTFERWVQTALA